MATPSKRAEVEFQKNFILFQVGHTAYFKAILNGNDEVVGLTSMTVNMNHHRGMEDAFRYTPWVQTIRSMYSFGMGRIFSLPTPMAQDEVVLAFMPTLTSHFKGLEVLAIRHTHPKKTYATRDRAAIISGALVWKRI